MKTLPPASPPPASPPPSSPSPSSTLVTECHPEQRARREPKRLPLLLLLLLFFPPQATRAQLPPGTTDTTAHPQSQPQDPRKTQAEAALSQQDYRTALKLLTALTDQNPNDSHLLYNLAFTQDALDQPAAEATYRRATAADPTYLGPHLALGLLLARNGKLPKARAELLTATTLTSPDPELKARAYRALARLDQRTHPDAARTELLAALKLSPETPEDTLLAAELAAQANDPAAAEQAYRRLLATTPNDPSATAALAHLLIRQQKSPEAEALLTAALVQHPDDPVLNSQLATLNAAQGKTAEAVAIAQKLHAANPSDSHFDTLLARLYTQAGQYAQAEPLFAALSARSPQDPALLDDHADTLIHLRRYAEAEVLLKRAVSNPEHFANPADLAAAASHLAFAASENNDPETALQAITLRDTLQPSSPSSLFLAATAQDKLHQTAKARTLYKAFLAVADGKFPDQEWQARHRLVALEHEK